ncbi:MAG: AbrB/MazE/SpoVT family DNA-binding domain-containing protein [Lachnospiraceae bacterium]|nr:AbrB/MazE/SpoVT family DNA-binding domain-containing protein [Lachnospiraceae bacterium]
MELAKVTSKGQITIPIEIRKMLGISEGSKILFIEEAGRIYITNSSMEALKEAQKAFAGVAEELGLASEENVVSMIKELRKEGGRK